MDEWEENVLTCVEEMMVGDVGDKTQMPTAARG
jgi:hypothetical protein